MERTYGTRLGVISTGKRIRKASHPTNGSGAYCNKDKVHHPRRYANQDIKTERTEQRLDSSVMS